MFTVYRAVINGQGCSGAFWTQPWGMATGTNPWDGNTDPSGYPAIDQVSRGTCLDQIRGDNPIN
jgi:hypothetical protein